MEIGPLTSKESKLLENLRITVANSRSKLGYTRGFIQADIEHGNVSWAGIYLTGEDRIRIRHDYVFGESGQKVAGHEYGHALQNNGLGGYANDECTNSYSDENPYGCADREGFADFHALVTREASMPSTVYGYEGNYARSAGEDGARVPRVVAAFLYDLYDANNEAPHDQAAYPAQYLASIYATCERFSTSWGAERGVNHIIDCLENRLETGSGYFASAPHSLSFRESATEPSGWDSSAIRSSWLYNFYGVQ